MSERDNGNNTRKASRSRLISFMAALMILQGIILLLPEKANAQGNLLITPRRVLFEGSARSMDLNLANTGSDSATYAISVVQIRMTDNGAFETISEPDPGQRFADRYIRYFPRTVTLAPGEAQLVKVQVTRRSGMEDGEYRSHFYFRAVPNTTPMGEEEIPSDTTTISIRLVPVFGITIPVIIRVGESTTEVTLSDLKVEINENNTPVLNMTFNRTGNMSVYGDLVINHISPSGTVTRVGIANGVAVYTPNAIRRFRLNLSSAPGVDYSSGKLKITYSASSDVRPGIYAESELQLN
ncbi:MAG: hypothetical protein ABR519_01290 [Bacteroidales bacterium]